MVRNVADHKIKVCKLHYAMKKKLCKVCFTVCQDVIMHKPKNPKLRWG